MCNELVTPVVSVIIPIYKVEQYLCKCIESVRNQTLHNIEIILVDDGSPDNCPAICDEFAQKDSRIRVIHKKNAGLGYARNSGLKASRGRWICFVDSDDCIEPETLNISVAIGEQSKADQVRFLFNVFYHDDELLLGNISVDYSCIILDKFPDKTYPMLSEITHVLDYMKTKIRSAASAWSAIYRKDIILENNICFPSERDLISEDYIFNLDYAASCGAIAYTSNQFYHYRMNPHSLTSFKTDRVVRSAECCRFMETHMHELGYTDAEILGKGAMFGYLRTHLWHIFLSDMPEEKKRELFNEAVNHPYINEIASRYPLSQLPVGARIAFEARRSYMISRILVVAREWLRKMLKK